jgi:hypothetical protein
MADVRLRGRVRRVDGDATPAAVRVVVTSSGSVVGDMQVDADGRFDLVVPPRGDLVVTMLGQDRRALRLRPDVSGGELVDLGELDVPVAEFPPGVSGQAWDLYRDRPAVGGVATLRRGEEVVGADRIDINGEFAIEMTANHLLQDGTYQLVVEAPGYQPCERRVQVTDDITSYRIGRVELTAATPD